MPLTEIDSYQFDGFVLEPERNQLSRDGERVQLTNKAFQLLTVLVRQAGETVEKERIYEELWADSFVEDANLTQQIYKLRKTLGPSPSGEPYIETVARTGYRFRASVTVIRRPEPAAGVAEDENVLGVHQASVSSSPITQPYISAAEDSSTNGSPERGTPGYRRLVVSGVFVITLLVTLMIGVYLGRARTNASLDPDPANRSLAVLPFRTIGDDAGDESLGLGMADAVITQLGKLREVPVRPTSAVFQYTDHPPENSPAAGRELGVNTVLEGSIQRDQDRIRVSVRLLNVADGGTLWADTYDENYGNIFAVQDSISAKVARALEVRLTQADSARLTDHSTNNTDAYQAYLLGVYFENFRDQPHLEQAVEYFQKAIDLDPNYARAYAQQGDTFNLLGYYNFRDPAEMRKKAAEVIAKALELDDRLPEGYVAMAYVHLITAGEVATAKQLLEKAIEISPYNANAHVRYGWVLLNLKDLKGAEEQMRLAQSYDPLSSINNAALSQVLAFEGNFAEAINYGEKAAALTPTSYNYQLILADIYFAAGRQQEAIDVVSSITKVESPDRLRALGLLAYFQAKLGDRKAAVQTSGELKKVANERPIVLNDLVAASYALGEREEGLRYLAELHNRRINVNIRLNYYPSWEDVRKDPRALALGTG
ncbi:MAG: winged helix-turn-helix domain-containing protein [Acidobacteria bacterium]|nr:winged helix-turn-helix domain-containing protein [Acidobacteriota bacterium]